MAPMGTMATTALKAAGSGVASDDEDVESSAESILSGDEPSGDEELDILDMGTERSNDSTDADDLPLSARVSLIWQERPTVRLLSSTDTENIRWLLFKVKHNIDNIGFCC
ncbi:hypothetical protein V1505DRAFT_359035 [Lipomyces doorenjongii]